VLRIGGSFAFFNRNLRGTGFLPATVCSDSAVFCVESTQIGRTRNRLIHWAIGTDFGVPGQPDFRSMISAYHQLSVVSPFGETINYADISQ
jgi:hypothetical protein